MVAINGYRRYSLIDQDPHASRVLRYMRPSDYTYWAAITAGLPAGLVLFPLIYFIAFWALHQPERADPVPAPMGRALKLCAGIGFIGGFLFAYQRSTLRFWGWTENKQEYTKDFEELSERARQGLALYGESGEPEFVQMQAFRNSKNSQLKFGLVPWFNLVNHPYHGVDPAKYGEDAFLVGPPRKPAGSAEPPPSSSS